MIDETAIRAALEAKIGQTFNGIPVTRIDEGCHHHGPHIRTYMVREGREELYRGIRRVKGMFGLFVHVPVDDGVEAAEGIAKGIPPLFRSSETENATISAADGTAITIREVSMMSSYRGADEGKSDHPWVVVPVQVDWRVDITAN